MVDPHPKTVSVLTRLSGEQADALDQMLLTDPSLPSRPAVIRHLIEAATDAPSVAAETGTLSLSSEDVDRLIAAIDARTRAYNQVAKQVRALGHLTNTLTKLAHQGVTYGRDVVVPTQAVELVARRLQHTRTALTRIAEQDAASEAVMQRCLRP